MFRSPQDNWSRFLLWVDAVGGYWVCSSPRVTLGQPRPVDEPDARGPDVPIFANLSRRHACLHRDGEEYWIEAFRSTWVNDQEVERAASLRDGDIVRLGEAVRLRFHKSHPLSATARLELLSSHRMEPSVRAILLMAGTCVLGPKSDSHVLCRDWLADVMLSLHGSELRCRGPAAMVVDGRTIANGKTTLHNHSKVRAECLSFSVEQLEG